MRPLFTVSFKDVLDAKRIQDLDELADSVIKVRGYDLEKVKVPSDLKRSEFFLPVNEIVSDYCPTHRYSYVHKKGQPLKPTWPGLKGRIIDELYGGLFEEARRYVTSTTLDKFLMAENLQQHAVKAVAVAKEEIEKTRPKLRDPPDEQEANNFLRDLGKIFRYESQLCGALLDYRISSKKDIRLHSEFVLLFPFNLKCKIAASDLGFSGSAEPDFIYSSRVVGDIKTGPWRDSFELTLAAYALAYENENHKNMNLGIIVNPDLTDTRTVPLHTSSDVRMIEDVTRRAVLINRDRRLTMIRDDIEPPPPDDKTLCQPCGYYDYCWPGEAHA